VHMRYSFAVTKLNCRITNSHLKDTCEAVWSDVSDIYARGQDYLGSWRFSSGDMLNEIHTNTAAVIQARTHTFLVMLERTIAHGVRFARKFALGTRSGITLVHEW
jgi:hypothetical protein